MLWQSRIDVLESGRIHRVALLRDGAAVSYAKTVERWRTDEAFRAFFVKLLAGAPFEAYFWEVPPVTRATAARAFEFVLVNSPALAALAPEPGAFAAHLEPSTTVATFSNLGGDALLVAPTAQGPPAVHAHLAAFVRDAPDEQQHALWQAVGAAVAERLSPAPLWLSTSGLGVAWLHVRLDRRPKYYSYPPYRSRPG